MMKKRSTKVVVNEARSPTIVREYKLKNCVKKMKILAEIARLISYKDIVKQDEVKKHF